MRHLHKLQTQWFHGKLSWFFSGLVCVVLLAAIWGCGKLSDDTSQPSTPIGTSGGIPVNGGPKDTQGTYHLNLTASHKTIPADRTTYSVLSATLSDESGRIVQGYTVNFSTSGNIGWFYEPVSGQFVPARDSVTGEKGTAQIRLYGSQSGDVTVTAAIDLNNDGLADITDTVVVKLTSSGPPDAAGNYSITVGVSPKSVPADLATYATVYVTVRDRTGGPVENMVVTFTSELGYVHNEPTPPSTWSTTTTALTNDSGNASIYYYGDRAGSAVITASVRPSDLVGTLTDTTRITVTEGPGVPGPGVDGLFISADPYTQTVNANNNGLAENIKPIIFKVSVFDKTGDAVGAGVRVEATSNSYGSFHAYATTDPTGIATFTYAPSGLPIGAYNYEFDVCTYGIVPKHCEESHIQIVVLPPNLNVEVSVTPGSIDTGKSAVVRVRVTYLGQPLGGAYVSYSSSGLISDASGNSYTNSVGVATFTVTGGSAGSETVFVDASATANGIILTGQGQAGVTITAPTTP